MKKLTISLILFSIFNFHAQELVNKSKDTIGVLKIGDQTWMKWDLNVTKFRNGDPIPLAQSDEEWAIAAAKESPAYCVNYGRYFYNHYAVSDTRGIAPGGFEFLLKKILKNLLIILVV